MTGTLTFKSPVKKYFPGDTYNTDYTANTSGQFERKTKVGDLQSYIDFRCSISASTGYWEGEGKEIKYVEETRRSYAKTGSGSEGVTIPSGDGQTSGSAIFSGTIPKHEKGYDVMQIRIGELAQSTMGGGYVYAYYYYSWHENLILVEGSTDSDSDSSQSDNSDWIIQEESRNALESSGEDSGTEIDADIITGKKDKKGRDDDASTAGKAAGIVGGTVVAVGAAAAASANKKKKKIIYKMYIDKDFGDTIAPGKPYVIKARIVQIHTENNMVRNADELTRKITVSSSELKVSSSASNIQAPYACMVAVVRLDRAIDSNYATVTFTLQGKGGVFSEHLRFKVDTERYIRKLYLTPDKKPARVVRMTDKFVQGVTDHNIFLGENVCTDIYLLVHGFYQIPKAEVFCADESLLKPVIGYMESLDASTKEVTQNDLIFKIDLHNLTKRPDYERQPDLQNTVLNNNISNAMTVFEKCEHTTVTVRFTSADGVFMTTSLKVNIIPRGFYYDISQSDDRQKSRDYIELYTNQLVSEDKSDLRETFIPIYYGCVQLEPKFRYLDITNKYVNFNAKLDDSFIPITTYGENIKVKFHLRITVNPPEKGGGLMFRPKIPVIEEKKDIRILYKICLTAEEIQYGKASPVLKRGYYLVRVHGEPIESEFHERHKLMRTISTMIRLFELDGNDKAVEIEKNFPKMSTYQMKVMIGWLFEIGNEAQKKVKAEADMWNTIYTVGIYAAETTKFVCDIAFSMMLKYIALQYRANPDIADAIITPMKEFIEEVAVKLYNGEEVGFEIFVDKYESIWENLIFTGVDSAIDFYNTLEKTKKKSFLSVLVSLVALGAIINAGKHWYIESCKDEELIKSGKQPEQLIIWRVMKNVFKDMSINGLKLALAKLFSKYLGETSGSKAVFKYKMIEKLRKNAILTKGYATAKLIAHETRAFNDMFGAIAIDATMNNIIPEIHKTTLDAGFSVIEDQCAKAKDNINQIKDLTLKMYVNIDGVIEALKNNKVDADGYLMVTTADNETLKIPSLLIISDLIENTFRELNIAEHLSAFFSNPPHLPDEMPYQSYKDTREALRMYGLTGEAKYLDSLTEFDNITQLRSTAESTYAKNPVAQQLDSGLFDSSTQPGTFNAGTDFRRYNK